MGSVDPIVPDRYLETVERIRHYVAEWEGVLDLPGVEVIHRFIETVRDDEEGTAADTEVKWQYRRATMRWYLPVLIGTPDDELESILVHEYCHVLLGPLASHLKPNSVDFEEFAVESIARALLSTANAYS